MKSSQSLSTTTNKKSLHLCWGENDLHPEGYEGPILRLDLLEEPWEKRFLEIMDSPQGLQRIFSLTSSKHPEVLKRLPKIGEIVHQIKSDIGGKEDALLGIGNIFKNKNLILKHGDISRAKCSYQSATMIAAGPSMNEQWDLINKDTLIIACDVMLHRCLENGIKPHIVVTSERVEMMSQFLEGENHSNTVLVSTLVAHPETIAKWEGILNFVVRRDFMSHWLPFKKRQLIEPYASVIPTALGILGVLGIKNVLLLGQDLCFQDGKSHAGMGKKHEKVKDWIEEEEHKNFKLKTICYDGEERQTTVYWNLTKLGLSSAASKFNMNLVSASKRGAVIEGARYMHAEEWADSVPLGGEFVPEKENRLREKEKEDWDKKTQSSINNLIRMQTHFNSYHPKSILEDPSVFGLAYSASKLDFIMYTNDLFQRKPEAEKIFRQKLSVLISELIQILKESQK